MTTTTTITLSKREKGKKIFYIMEPQLELSIRKLQSTSLAEEKNKQAQD